MKPLANTESWSCSGGFALTIKELCFGAVHWQFVPKSRLGFENWKPNSAACEDKDYMYSITSERQAFHLEIPFVKEPINIQYYSYLSFQARIQFRVLGHNLPGAVRKREGGGGRVGTRETKWVHVVV